MSVTKKTLPAPTAAPGAKKALKLTKDTLRDLAASARHARNVKGGLTTKCPKNDSGGGSTVIVA